jgi:Uma2 family endonuclease
MSANPKRHYTVEEYFELDRTSQERLEFFKGEVFAMGGGSLRHDDLIVNVIRLLGNQLEKKGTCRVSGTEARMKAPDSPSPYHYADASVTCGKREIEMIGGQQVLCNPVLIVEVLSPTTAAYDQSDKFTFYKSIPCFREYMLIAQDKVHMTLYVKQGENQWLQSEFLNLSNQIYLPSVDCRLDVQDVYRGIEFLPE